MNYLNLLNYDTPRELTMVDLPKGHRDHPQWRHLQKQTIGSSWYLPQVEYSSLPEPDREK